MQLTEEQRQIVEADFEHCVITAVAGSGKTTTLAHRICYLLSQGHDPRRLLVLMFNRAAKEDFEKKLIQVADNRYHGLPEVRTYHAMGLRLYRRFIQEGVLNQYVGDILSEQEIHFQLWVLLRRLAPESQSDAIKRNKKDYIELAATLLDLSKTTLQSLELTFEQLNYPKQHGFLKDVVQAFEHWRKQEARITFADMLYEPVKALSERPDLQRLIANKMDMILVDEYQDTNEIQHLLLGYIAGQRARVTVVGDPDQTIYEFRGAQPEFILNRFAEEFESPRDFTLSYTFRYGHQVALLANHLITHNTGRKDVLCRSHPTTPQTRVNTCASRDEAKSLISDIKSLQASGAELGDIAILFRVWSQAVGIELALLAARIPYHIDHGKGALANRELNQVLALLELSSGRIIQYSPERRAEMFVSLLRFPHVGLKEDALRELAAGLSHLSGDWCDYLLDWIPESLHSIQKRKLRHTAMAWQQAVNSQASAAEVLHQYIDATELFKNLEELALTHENADERINHVLAMEHYLRTLNQDPLNALDHFDELRQRAQKQEKNAGVTLATMHRTKGLEWPVVMILGLNEQYLPYTLRSNEDIGAHLQAERRLLYVAMTRAKQGLYLYRPGTPHPTSKDTHPSRFLAEMHTELSVAAGEYLDEGKTCSDQEVFQSPKPLTPVLKRYLDWHKVHYHAPERAADTEARELWHYPRLRHAVLGSGNVLGDLDDAFEMEFADGSKMTFSKKSAHLYFIVEEAEEVVTIH
ncbi:DNA helicase UvrD [Hahella sp. CCB-MM4]|uniref:ATP-dependent helicase n=1 Tax=Hahella sp. (strain CCB-MM4) TaxID=1926491 RepID=UPI000B9B4FFA|nr:ATP-dependent helicase [Hahella sp. CCB-MM4]OZG75111.1 DNA helicase UvrD [Hahella sp. CCB-MM4]